MASTGTGEPKSSDVTDNSSENRASGPNTLKDNNDSSVHKQTTDDHEDESGRTDQSNIEGTSENQTLPHTGSDFSFPSVNSNAETQTLNCQQDPVVEDGDTGKRRKLDDVQTNAIDGDLSKGDNLSSQEHKSSTRNSESGSLVRQDSPVAGCSEDEPNVPHKQNSLELEKKASESGGRSDEPKKLESGNSNQDQLRVELPPLEGATASCSDAPAGTVYHIKWIQFKASKVPIITQNENGPCPLLAIINVLLLQGRVKLASMMEMITADQLMTYLGDCILENVPKDTNEAVQLNFEQNMHDAMAVIHKLQTGLDVNVKFTGVRDFEYTPECIIFDLLEIALFHGWLVDPQDDRLVNAIGTCSYNQLVEKIIADKASDKETLITEALLAEAFLDRTAAQLTYHGLCELSTSVKDGELCVFFRNNHFSTMYRNKNELFLLVTDQGFLTESSVVWETLSNVEGDCHFVDGSLHTYTKPEASTEAIPPPHVSIGSEEQIDQDFLVALSLQHDDQVSDEVLATQDPQTQMKQQQLCDHDLAIRLQEEENRRAQAAQRAPAASNSSGRRNRDPRESREQRGREKEKEKDCQIL